jgi:hypothetical protein
MLLLLVWMISGSLRRAAPRGVALVEERITGLLDSDDGRSLFVQGYVRNQSKFYDRFNAVVLLSAPADVILDRIARRTTNNLGRPLSRDIPDHSRMRVLQPCVVVDD